MYVMPSINVINAFAMLAAHLELHYKKPHVMENLASVRRKVDIIIKIVSISFSIKLSIIYLQIFYSKTLVDPRLVSMFCIEK